ncbi:MAG: PAS domain S-box protein [Rubrivivax sp.]|nr:PAS domain S-box protein [Rubrivivax sp.]
MHPQHAADAAHDGGERLLRILQTMAEGLFIIGADGRYAMVNAAAEQILGVAADHIVGRRHDQVPWRRWELDGSREARHPLERLLAGEPAVRRQVMGIERPDGLRRVISVNGLPLRDAQGRFDGMVGTFEDVTERHAAELALADSRARLSAIVDSASDAIISTDADGRIVLFNPAAARIFGRPAAGMLGQPLDVLLPEALRQGHGAQVSAFARAPAGRGALAARRVTAHHADGRTLDLEASVAQAVLDGRPVLTAVLRDVTERAAQERALEATRAELVELTRRLLDQEKQTTRRLAQALHDELGQTLTALRLHWDAAAAAGGPPGEALRTRLDQLVEAANRQVRQVLGELRPPLLDEFGLGPALDNELQQRRPVDGRPALVFDLLPRLQAQRWPADVEYAAFMIAREAVLNALHHAGASRLDVYLDGDDGELMLTVRDDGRGFRQDGRAAPAGHLGLVGMRERAQAIAGWLGIASAPGRGTIVTLAWCAPDEPPV